MPVRYSKGRFLGKGGFARCYEVQHLETREIFAAKIVAKASVAKPRAHAKLRSEIAIHQSLEHERVVKFYNYFEDTENVYIILEMCPNQTLNELMRRRPSKRMSEAEAMFYAYDLLMALRYLHRRRVIHRDLKLGNLFLDANMRLRVGDFGLAAQLEHDGDRKRTICGTPNYIAPEILDGQGGHSYEVDIWSFGVVLYTMLIGRPPFETSDVKATYRRIRYNDYSFPENVPVSEASRDLIRSILRTDPQTRPSLEGILASQWFQSVRLPPAMPGTLAVRGSSPRMSGSCGGTPVTKRSDTPERGAADFARIDSPVARCPLRERSPLSVRAPPQATVPAAANGSQSPHVQPVKKAWQQGQGVPRAPASNGRPPSATMRNDENAPPLDSGASGKASHNMLRGNVAGCPATAQAGQSASNQSQPAQHQAALGSAANRTPVRDPSPLGNPYGPGAPSSLCNSARLPGGSGTVSPQRAAASGAVHRLGTPTLCTPKTGMHSARGSSPAPRASHEPSSSGPALARTSPAATSHATPSGPSSRRQANASESPCRTMRGAYSASHGVATPTGSTATREGSATDRRGRCASSPALGHNAILQALGGPSGNAANSRRTSSSSANTLGPSAAGSSSARLARGAAPSPVADSAVLAGPVAANSSSSSALPEMWVSRWVDYSSKYGIGYVLSDGAIGVYFNDSTKAVLNPDGRRFDYVTRRTQDKPEMMSTHSIDDFPEDLRKKVTLLRHFRGFLLGNGGDQRNEATSGESSLPFMHPQPEEPASVLTDGTRAEQPYVKKWMRNDRAILFQLSNKIVQVIFFDRTEAVLSSKAHSVVYVDKHNRERCTYPLSSILDVPNPELAKRLRYTKEFLVQVLSGGARPSGSARPAEGGA